MSGLIDLLSVENSRIKKELGVRQEAIKNYHIEWCSANVKIAELTAKNKELESDLKDRTCEVNLRCGQIQERDIRIAELTAKLDKAREALKWSLATIDVSDWEDDIHMSEACGKYAWATHVHRELDK